MNRKEASFILANIDRRVCDDELNEALDMAIKALEQEPKTDSWSIKDVADTFKKHGLIRVQEPSGNAINRKLVCAFIDGLISDDVEREKGLEYIRNMPPVNPTKTGHWIETAEEYYKAVNEYGGGVNEDTPYFVDDIACSVCLAKYSVIDNETERFDCCPSCGVKLVEPQESEEI